jgi:D-lactate dehydrogenase (cytochrome)
VTLLPIPKNVLSSVVFFKTEGDLLAFVREARARSLHNRATKTTNGIDARALEYFDVESLKFLHAAYPLVPQSAQGAVFFEQETTGETEDDLMSEWLELVEGHNALLDDSWFATNENDRTRIREFRHKLPVLVNEWLSHHKQCKVSTDMAVPDHEFERMLAFYKDGLRENGLHYVIFGHIGDNHVHVNILPRSEEEAAAARELYRRFIVRAVEVGGTISAEHGIGKLKRDYLRVLYGDEHMREMAALKRAFDPAGILGRGNIFSEEYL